MPVREKASMNEVVHSDKEDRGVVYQSGFGNTFESETVKGSLPLGRNSPREVPFDLYAEQLSGTAFTRPRHMNQRTWIYRKQPSAAHNGRIFECNDQYFGGENPEIGILDPNPLRWLPFDGGGVTSEGSKDFVSGTHLLGSSGDPAQKMGIAIYVYLCQESMSTKNNYMYNSDGDFLILPQEGGLEVRTELGILIVQPGEFCVIPRGIVFAINLLHNNNGVLSRGFLMEIYKGHFTLPELGPIGSNGLANARDFLYPTAWTEVRQANNGFGEKTLFNKFGSKLWSKTVDSSPFNVVAWHGNYLPYKYNLSKFCAVNSVTYDHIDPSVYTVLTCPGLDVGEALCDFVIFPPRWMSTDPETFRPPWFHRNCMTEFMGLLWGGYDAKKAFLPGGASLHSCMTPHGPDAVSYDKAVADPCDHPTYLSSGLAFMFETSCMLRLTEYALNHKCRDLSYGSCWKGLPNRFDGTQADD